MVQCGCVEGRRDAPIAAGATVGVWGVLWSTGRLSHAVTILLLVVVLPLPALLLLMLLALAHSTSCLPFNCALQATVELIVAQPTTSVNTSVLPLLLTYRQYEVGLLHITFVVEPLWFLSQSFVEPTLLLRAGVCPARLLFMR